MTYNQLWHSLASIYDEGEAKAIVRTVLDTVFGLSMTDVYSGKVTQLSEEECHLLEEIMYRLQKSEPVQYVLREARFCGRTFKVRPGVLIPRPETEELCKRIRAIHNSQCTIHNYKGLNTHHPSHTITEGDSPITHHPPPITHHPSPITHHPSPTILDIGTGSGCIAITVALDCPGAQVTGWDISSVALETARENAERLGANVRFCRQDALKPPHDEAVWDVIVSNPPYICQRERAAMHPNVVDYEPDKALFVPDKDPLRFYRAISAYAIDALRPGGHLLFEINPIYSAGVAELLSSFGFTDIEIRNDPFGRKRFVLACRHGTRTESEKQMLAVGEI